MKITAQEEYGLRCLLQLARTPQGSIVSVKEIAAKEGLSWAYVEKLLRLLARAGLVHSMRGVKGGYVLSRSAKEITLSEVIRVLGNMPSTSQICNDFTGNKDLCVHFNDCGIRSVWSGLTNYIQNFMDHTTVESLLNQELIVTEQLAKRLNANGKN